MRMRINIYLNVFIARGQGGELGSLMGRVRGVQLAQAKAEVLQKV